MADAVADNRIKTADWRARVEEKLDRLNEQVVEALDQAKEMRRNHSRRLDRVELIIAQQEQAEKERARLRADVDNLKREQRWWTGIVSVVTAVVGYFGVRD